MQLLVPDDTTLLSLPLPLMEAASVGGDRTALSYWYVLYGGPDYSELLVGVVWSTGRR